MNRELRIAQADRPVIRRATAAACGQSGHFKQFMQVIRPALGGLCVAVLLGGCAATPARTVSAQSRTGVIQSIDQIAPRHVSALAGMFVGGVLGSANNGTENRSVGLALGALGGAWAIRTSAGGASPAGFVVTVRMDDGEVGRFEHATLADVRVGQHVGVERNRLVTERLATQ